MSLIGTPCTLALELDAERVKSFGFGKVLKVLVSMPAAESILITHLDTVEVEITLWGFI